MIDLSTKYDKLIEVMLNTRVPKPATELAVLSGLPTSSVYRQLKDLTAIEVVLLGKVSMLAPTGRQTTVTTYAIDPARLNNYKESLTVLGVIPSIFNQISRRLYTLLELVERYDTTRKTGGAKAADSYLDAATELLWLATQEPNLDTRKRQVTLREYLQQALPVAQNVCSQIEQMLVDKRLWSDDLYVLSANGDVRDSVELINLRHEQIDLDL